MQYTAFNKLYEVLKNTGLSDNDINALLFNYLIEELVNVCKIKR